MPYFMPCPFCGASGPLVCFESDISGYVAGIAHRVCRVKCVRCKAQGPTFSSMVYPINCEELAREAWNMRTPTD